MHWKPVGASEQRHYRDLVEEYASKMGAGEVSSPAGPVMVEYKSPARRNKEGGRAVLRALDRA